jgi:hypothetical protein
VAAMCEEEDLTDVGGPLGRTLFLKSRNMPSPAKKHSLNSLSFQSLSLVPPQGGEDEDEDGDEGEQQEADVEAEALAT